MRRILLTASLASLAACASASSTAADRPRRDSSVISSAEIATIQVSNALEVIERLRPNMLRSRGMVSINSNPSSYPVVYVDGQLMGELAVLRNLTPTAIREIRLLSANDATTRFGIGHPGGAIVVTTGTGQP